jgi:hypothetical protein
MENETRDRVRELVKQVLANSPVETEPTQIIEHIIVNSLKNDNAKEFDRDESAKNLLTEDDLRGLEFGAKVRVAENVKLTPLASDIVREKSIELIKKSRFVESSNGRRRLRSRRFSIQRRFEDFPCRFGFASPRFRHKFDRCG